MTDPKRHLLVRIRRRSRTACGLAAEAHGVTGDPSLVTCGSCQRTEKMAIAELRERQKRRP